MPSPPEIASIFGPSGDMPLPALDQLSVLRCIVLCCSGDHAVPQIWLPGNLATAHESSRRSADQTNNQKEVKSISNCGATNPTFGCLTAVAGLW
jgi:hypothetical protein